MVESMPRHDLFEQNALNLLIQRENARVIALPNSDWNLFGDDLAKLSFGPASVLPLSIVHLTSFAQMHHIEHEVSMGLERSRNSSTLPFLICALQV